ncbi:MAG: MurE/MurF fusion protein, partial [Pseudomonadota bacterium]|nr:MurE/MurF fusion protein [Pseudomonadota bacterium]
MSAAAEVLRQLATLGVEPLNVTDDSRLVAPGDLVLAFPGGAADGRRYIADAIARGAAAVVWESVGADGVDWATLTVPNIAVTNLRALAGNIAHAVLGEPSERLSLIAVTGTNGKTSCSQWIARTYPRRCAIIGTLGAGFPEA